MQKKYESTTMGAKKKEKKTVSWVDGKSEGQIDESNLEIGTSASPSKEKLLEKINGLMKEGYTEIEAAAIVGRPLTSDNKVIIDNPIFYASKEEIQKCKLLREQSTSQVTPVATSAPSDETPLSSPTKGAKKEENRYSFFSPTTIGVGIVALAVAATIGIVASRK